MPRRHYTPFEVGVKVHFIKEDKPIPPKESWWTKPTATFQEFTDAARARDSQMGWSAHGRGGRECKTMYEEWKFTR